ncbi:MAG: hypothetical protein K0R41_3614, partial [Geminicoccaceae bacterium]|nr:hypothetical protein [Geminicoccaceae bacterium]
NGLSGKLEKLLLPLLKGSDKHAAINDLCKLARNINGKRNDIVHRGEFCSKKVARDLISSCEKFVIGMIKLYAPDFDLQERCERRTRA